MLGRWAGWGAIPHVFDERNDSEAETRARVRELLGDDAAFAHARRSTLNAHYTSAEVVQAMWGTVERLGFTGGRVLEPGCGAGNFIGFAPDTAEVTGVELDPTTAAIARHLYGARAAIHHGAFEEFAAADGSCDVVIGNVPFAKVTPHDPRHNRGRHSLHNYCIVKSLHLTRPGGLVALLTSRYTLDAHDPSARGEMAALADLVGALRLPAGAFRASSGTEVVIDLLVLRRRPPDTAPEGPEWRDTRPAPIDDIEDPPLINDYFLAHPKAVLGDLKVTRGMYRDHELTVEASGPLDATLPGALDRLVSDALRRDAVLLPATPPRAQAQALDSQAAVEAVSPAVGEEARRFAQEGSFVLTETGGVARIVDGDSVRYTPRVRKDLPELRRLVALRDAARATLACQLDDADDTTLAEAQEELGRQWDAYRAAHGPINRYRTARTGRVDPDTGEEIRRRLKPRMGGFRDDPDWPLVAALEVFDEDTQAAQPAAIFSERVIEPPVTRDRVDTPTDAIAVCLDESGQVTAERAAQLLDIDADEARRLLAPLVFEDPETRELVPAARYLSGNVRAKLAVARTAAERDPVWQGHVDALEAALPPQLEPGEIRAQLGAPWIPARDVEAFADEVLDARVEAEWIPEVGTWTVKSTSWRGSVALTSEWGTARADGITLLDASLNQRLHTVYDQVEDKKRVRNDSETIAAREKQEALKDRFAAWVWEDDERARRLADAYNELFSSYVVPTYDGSHLTLPGLSADFTPHQHQRDAVARILAEGRAGLFHAVGAGKTATIVMAAMEMRRLGSAAKPAVAVPNHMLEQFSREWLQLYPTARLLLADRDRVSKERRKEFVARAATGDWDAIVFTHSTFGRLPLKPETLAEYLGDELDRARAGLERSREGKRLSVKRVERRIAQLDAKYQELLAKETKDDGVHFEETGIDYLFVDELHLFKNLQVISSVRDLAHQGSRRAQDLDAKLVTLRRLHGHRSFTGATATPLANSMAEMWVMQHYLQPDVLDHTQTAHVDAWAANFGRVVTALELAPNGASYRLNSRMARFQNVPELLTMWLRVADVRTKDDLNLPGPAIVGGKPQTVVVPPTPELLDYVARLAERAELVRNRAVDPTEDNMLKITGDGRRAALDLRLVGEPTAPDSNKLAVAADTIARIHGETRELRYLDIHGEPAPRPGALQLVFCDTSTPNGDGWNAYTELRQLLAARGVPAERVRFIHEASSDDAKAKLFAACRDGRVAVLVGSTEKMGVGTNVQARAVAVHDLDCPWRPADLEQRLGRAERQGNQNPEIHAARYVTEGSFDIYSWQTVERKATFIDQVTAGRITEREIDDLGDDTLTYAEVKALATGDPLIREKADVDAEIARLARLRNAHHDDQHRLRRTAERARQTREAVTARIDALTAAIARRIDTSGDRFAVTLDGRRFTKRVAAGEALKTLGTIRLDNTPAGERSNTVTVGELGGFPITLTATKVLQPEIIVTLDDTPVEIGIPELEWRHADPAPLIQRLERRLHRLEDTLTRTQQQQEDAAHQLRRARERLGQPFEHDERLRDLQRRQHEIEDQLIVSNDSATPAPDTTRDAPPNPSGEDDPAPSPRAVARERLDRHHQDAQAPQRTL